MPSSFHLRRARRVGRPLREGDGVEGAKREADVAADALGGVHRRGGGAAPAGRAEEVVDLAGHRRRFRVALDERLGAGRRAADEDALAARLGGAILAVEDLDEAVFVEIHAERLGDAAGVRGRHHAAGEHH